MNRRRHPLYWLARIALNGLAVIVFYVTTSVIGLEFSWPLYWCAFAVYVCISLGDALIDELWPPITGGPQS